jgi:lipoate-protein ligase A
VSDEVRTRYCKTKGIHINRRITGGGAIFFDESQLGWEIICEKKFFNISLVSDKLFKQICMAVIEGLKKLGVDAVFRPKNDIEINGRKISGTGGTELYGAFLFQGTLLVDFDVDAMIKSLKVPIDKLRRKEIESLKQRVTCLKRELGFTPVLSEIKNAVLAGFEKHLGIKYEFGTLTDEENNLFKEKVVYFQKNEWINNI